MELIALLCAQCGAPLEAPTNASFITCRHCSCHLAIKHSESATWSERLDAIQTQTAELATDMKKLMLERELERIDREWETLRAPLLIRGREPNLEHLVFQGVLAVCIPAVAAFFLSFSSKHTQPGMNHGEFAIPVVVIFGLAELVALVGLAFHWRSYVDFQPLRDAYLKRRAEVLAQLDSNAGT